MSHQSIPTLEHLVGMSLHLAGASLSAATITARALVQAEAQGLASHGLSRVAQYVSHLQHGRVNGTAEPQLLRQKGGALWIDAQEGFAFPALQLATDLIAHQIEQQAVMFAAITNSHHFGVAANHVLPLARRGHVAFVFGNSPAGLPAWGGKHAAFGTNPIAAVFPRQQADPLIIDLSLSQVARGKLMIAAKEGREIPLGWALDAQGQPTTDPNAGLQGLMCPAGGVKGAMLALIVELLCTTLTGAALGFEADSFFAVEGNRPRIGQTILAIDPGALAGSAAYHERIETLLTFILQDEDVRLPGVSRLANEQKAREHGIAVSDALWQQLQQLAGDRP
jgi:(2R)-3-sulfolactate dehydrogenase (NADP+)